MFRKSLLAGARGPYTVIEQFVDVRPDVKPSGGTARRKRRRKKSLPVKAGRN